jgi:hypothetical protein
MQTVQEGSGVATQPPRRDLAGTESAFIVK